MKGCHTVLDVVEVVAVTHVASNIARQPVEPLNLTQPNIRVK